MRSLNKNHADLVTGVVLVLAGIGLYIATYGIRIVPFSVSATIVPRICAVLLSVEGCLLAVKGYITIKRSNSDSEKGGNPKKFSEAGLKPALYFLFTLLLFSAYVLAFKPIGFFISTPVFLIVLIKWLSPADDKKWLQYVITAITATAVVFVIFVQIFQVMLPGGLLGY
jgi:putative tricarboxylic transport membrane protein